MFEIIDDLKIKFSLLLKGALRNILLRERIYIQIHPHPNFLLTASCAAIKAVL